MAQTIVEGIVTAVCPSCVIVRVSGGEVSGEIPCEIPRALLRGVRDQRRLLAVGDRGRIELLGAGRGVVRELLQRRTKIARCGSLRPLREHVIAANVNALLALQSLDSPPLDADALDRLLLLGETGGVACGVCLNKIDLGAAVAGAPLLAPYRAAGYPVFEVSALRGDGIAELATFLRGRETVFVGTSGVGKSTLLNRLVPLAMQRTAPVSAGVRRGVHTTTRVDYLDLPGGGVLLDTPGLRIIHPWGIAPAALASHFPELRPFLGSCRFRDCLHETEPGCAVREACDAGRITRARHAGYVRILAELKRRSPPGGRAPASG